MLYLYVLQMYVFVILQNKQFRRIVKSKVQKSKVRLDLAAFIFLGTTSSLIKFAKF